MGVIVAQAGVAAKACGGTSPRRTFLQFLRGHLLKAMVSQL
ncbi:MAG: hypothetical protein ABL970_08795 [Nitrospira sp.]